MVPIPLIECLMKDNERVSALSSLFASPRKATHKVVVDDARPIVDDSLTTVLVRGSKSLVQTAVRKPTNLFFTNEIEIKLQ